MRLVARPGRCEEASFIISEHYVPCNAPAESVVHSRVDNTDYRMCPACAWHAIKNRGMTYVRPYEEVKK